MNKDKEKFLGNMVPRLQMGPFKAYQQVFTWTEERIICGKYAGTGPPSKCPKIPDEIVPTILVKVRNRHCMVAASTVFTTLGACIVQLELLGHWRVCARTPQQFFKRHGHAYFLNDHQIRELEKEGKP